MVYIFFIHVHIAPVEMKKPVVDDKKEIEGTMRGKENVGGTHVHVGRRFVCNRCGCGRWSCRWRRFAGRLTIRSILLRTFQSIATQKLVLTLDHLFESVFRNGRLAMLNKKSINYRTRQKLRRQVGSLPSSVLPERFRSSR